MQLHIVRQHEITYVEREQKRLEEFKRHLKYISDKSALQRGVEYVFRTESWLNDGYKKHLCIPRVTHVTKGEEWSTLYIGRKNTTYNLEASKWANPYKITKDCTRIESIERYREYLLRIPRLLMAIPELRGHVLGCWCKTSKNPHIECHGDILVEFYSTWAEWSWVRYGYEGFDNIGGILQNGSDEWIELITVCSTSRY